MDCTEGIKRLDISLLMGDKIHVVKNDHFPEIGVHGHNYYELIFFRKAEVVSVVNGVNTYFGDYSLYLLTPFDFHETKNVRKGAEVDFTNISFTEDAVDNSVLNQIKGVYYIGRIDPNDDICMLIRLIENCKKYKFPDNERNKSCLLSVLLSRVISKGNLIVGENGVDHERSVIRKAAKYVSENYMRKITLDEISREMHLSPAYFSSVFSKSAGIAFTEYLLNYRLNYAKYLLLSTEKSVTDICFLSGFSSYSRFSRVFKAFYGITPTEFRRRERQINSN